MSAGVSNILPSLVDSLSLSCFFVADEYNALASDGRKPDRLQRKCRKFNRTLSEYRVLVEHVIGEVKCYKVIGTLWRHPRTKLKRVAEICAGLVCRRRQLNKTKLTVFFFCFNFETSPSYYTIIVVVSSPSPIV